MADITKCTNQTCKNMTCYRKTAPVNEFWQSYSYFGDEGCLFPCLHDPARRDI